MYNKRDGGFIKDIIGFGGRKENDKINYISNYNKDYKYQGPYYRDNYISKRIGLKNTPYNRLEGDEIKNYNNYNNYINDINEVSKLPKI